MNTLISWHGRKKIQIKKQVTVNWVWEIELMHVHTRKQTPLNATNYLHFTMAYKETLLVSRVALCENWIKHLSQQIKKKKKIEKEVI